MNYFFEFFSNFYLLSAFSAWATAQIIKFILTLIIDKKVEPRKLIANGGMPSSHTATVCALSVAIGSVHGMDSAIFAISLVFSIIVIADALGVRRATGENAKVINQITRDLFENENKKYCEKDLKELVGHKPLEVMVGAILGILVPIVINSL